MADQDSVASSEYPAILTPSLPAEPIENGRYDNGFFSGGVDCELERAKSKLIIVQHGGSTELDNGDPPGHESWKTLGIHDSSGQLQVWRFVASVINLPCSSRLMVYRFASSPPVAVSVGTQGKIFYVDASLLIHHSEVFRAVIEDAEFDIKSDAIYLVRMSRDGLRVLSSMDAYTDLFRLQGYPPRHA